MKKYKKAILDAFFLFSLIGLTFYFTVRDRNINDIIDAIQECNDWWLILAIVFVFIFIIGESIIMNYLYRILGTQIHLLRCIKYSFIGFFFSSVTPSATGGQPMQLYYMGKDDKSKISESALVLLIITIGYKSALVLMSTFAFIFQGTFIVDHLDEVVYILIYGVVVNLAFILFLFILIFHEALTERMIHVFVNVLYKLHIIKDQEKLVEKFIRHMKPYRNGAEYLKIHKNVFFHVLWMSIVQRLALFLVTWCVYRAFGLHYISMLQIVSLQTIISLSVDMLPLPGGVGASEKSFSILFDTIFGMELVVPGMILSRGISFYFLVLVTGAGTAIAHFLMVWKERKQHNKA
ncbi:MAG: flippase-like domain-containing protein [Dorea sp.]|nr:flippase-like domain-containing protein [Dorea sp.]